MRTIKELKWLLTAGKPSPALKAATLLYLHGVRISVSVKLKVRDADLGATPTAIIVDRSRPVFATDELSNLLMRLAATCMVCCARVGNELGVLYNHPPHV